MSIRVAIDGQIFTEDTAVISVFDRGFLYGDSVYEVARTSGGVPVDLDWHLERLERSAAAILLPMPALKDVARQVDDTLRAAQNAEAYLRVIVTRGAGEMGLDVALADRPRTVVIARPLSLPPESFYRDGIEVALVAVRRNLRRAMDPAVKSGNYLNNIMALAEARARGAYESIMCNAEGRVVEGSTSNLFVVAHGAIRTPALEDGLLDGITRRRVMELASSAGLTMGEGHLVPEDLRGADEAFLTSSIRGVMPVVKVDGRPVGDGRPGAATRTLMASYAEFLSRVAARKV
jgi:branched-chain amino acid aminotransferase